MKVLIVDDLSNNRYLLESILKGNNYEVKSAKNGVEALQILNKYHFDLIISDILMPKMDGYQFLRECKKNPEFKKIPFIFYSGTYTSKEDKEFALKLGADKFIVKPTETGEFIKIIEEVIEKANINNFEISQSTLESEDTFLKLYNVRLIEKLENKLEELQETNKKLKSEIENRKKAEKSLRASEEKFKNLFHTMFQGVVYQDAQGNIISANPAALKILGLNMDQLKDRTSMDPNWKSIHEDGSDFPGEDHPSMISLKTGKPVNNIIMGVFNPSENNYRWININAVPQFKPGEQKPVQVYTTLEDITYRKKIEDDLRLSLEEKEVLIKEIHHRVKNNMQIISSLLNLQKIYYSHHSISDIIKASQIRIKSMAMIHEKLYQSHQLSRIDFEDYIKSLISEISATYSVNQNKIEIEMEVRDIFLDIDLAIPCGLIINELVSNSLKHAFKDKEKGKINIFMDKKGNEYCLSIKDNGVGLSRDFDFENLNTLGMDLVKSLIKQIDGELEIKREKGTQFIIKFLK
ncbi:response regulator [Methanobacterium alkalithermotolerans]|uniref:Response regulator n=1 Tax=Methanobacterium alkalithermotolerans TaxID=2731220 RepID=A0A8T8K7Z8_9EURY|nr:histidine kinase dimerization/phosphoacceptor domain -containing protein [Methanobacterium alkalithermotolerans]QUH24157.1 response regulator [Methanobacterium alkalithermotolerans]